MKEYRYETSQGTEVFFYPNTSLHSFYLSLYVRAGSIYEDERCQGISHLLEHVCIRNIRHLTGGALYRTLDRLGLEFNAATYRDLVQFYISGPSARFADAVRILCMLFLPLTLPVAELDAERRRVKAEIRESDERGALSSFAASVLYPDSTGRFPILGTPRSLAGISRSRLEAYRREVMCAENVFFYATGCVTEDDIQGLVRSVDACDVPHGVRRSCVLPVPSAFLRRDAAVHVKGADYTLLRLSFDIDMTRVRTAECDLLFDALCTGYNARLFLELCEGRGSCYDVGGGIDRYLNVGSLYITFEIKSTELYDALSAAVDVLRRCKEQPMPKEELPYAVYVDGSELLLDDAAELNFTMAYDAHVLHCPYASLDDRRLAYAAVTPERLRDVARDVFRPEGCALCIKGDRRRIDTARLHDILMRLNV